MPNTYRWDDQTQTWIPTGEKKPSYAEIVEAQNALEQRKRDQDERDTHPGRYV